MPSTWAELGFSLAEHAGHASIDHLSDRLKRPKLATLADLQAQGQFKRLADLPGLSGVMVRAAPAAAAKPDPEPEPAPAPSAVSYAEEFAMADDTSPVACWPCTRRHVSACLVAAEDGAASTDPAARQAAAATILGEVAVWQRYDMTPEKLANTSSAKRQAVEAAVPGMLAACKELQSPPAHLAEAWSAAVEAFRFANSSGGNPSPLEQHGRDERMADVQGWVGYLDTLPLPPEAAPHLDAIRHARHALNRADGDPAAIAEMRDALRAAAVELTPDPGPESLSRAAGHLKDARTAFYAGAKSAMKAQREPALPSAKDAAEVLARPDVRTVFDRLDTFAERIGVPVRFRELGPEVLGLYLPQVPPHGSIVLSSAAQTKDPLYTETLAHEEVHALLHNLTADVYRSAGHEPEEQEAELASAAALAMLRLPVETWEGTPLSHDVPDWQKLRRQVGPLMARRIEWAARIEALAGEGDVDGAVVLYGQGVPR